MCWRNPLEYNDCESLLRATGLLTSGYHSVLAIAEAAVMGHGALGKPCDRRHVLTSMNLTLYNLVSTIIEITYGCKPGNRYFISLEQSPLPNYFQYTYT